MNKKTVPVLGAILIASLTAMATAKATRRSVQPQTPKVSRAEQVRRGQYLVTIGGCNDCHTPWIMQANGKPGPDMSRMLSGHPQQFPIAEPARLTSDRWAIAMAPTNTAFSGPWGVSFAANLSPDNDTGTGIWTFEIFKNTIRNGRHWGVARPLLPPMPWFNYREMSDADLAAVFAYLRTIKPIHNEVPQPLPPATLSASK